MIFNAEISNRRIIGNGTWEITFTHTRDDFYFNAGQYIWLISPTARKAFSITSSSADPLKLQVVFRENPGSNLKKFILDGENRNLKIKGACGFLRSPAKGDKTVYIVGGVGIAPVLSIVRSLRDKNESRDIEIIFANHSSQHQFYVDELQAYPFVRLTNIVGRFTGNEFSPKPDSKYYIFGKQDFVDSVYKILCGKGVLENNIFFEENYPSRIPFELNLAEDTYFKHAVDQSINHIVMTDINGRICYANQAATETTGYSFEEMKGQTPRLWGGLMPESVYKEFWKTLLVDKKPFRGEFKNQRKNGDLYDALAMISPITNKNSDIVGFLGIEQNITQTKASEENLKRLTELMVGRELEMIELKKQLKNGKQ